MTNILQAPWRLSDGVHVILDATGEPIMRPDMEEVELNAKTHLIAAAPELLAALELGARMRTLQKDYFKTRNLQTLREAQKIEREFDKAVEAVLAKVVFRAD